VRMVYGSVRVWMVKGGDRGWLKGGGRGWLKEEDG
jgi:hypothetical protein